MESSLAICRHLFVDHFLHPGQIPVLFPEGKPALPVPTEEIPLTLIDGASAHRAGSNALPGIKTVLFFHGYFPHSSSIRSISSTMPSRNSCPHSSPFSIRSRRFSHSAVIAADRRYSGSTEIKSAPSWVAKSCFPGCRQSPLRAAGYPHCMASAALCNAPIYWL